MWTCPAGAPTAAPPLPRLSPPSLRSHPQYYLHQSPASPSKSFRASSFLQRDGADA